MPMQTDRTTDQKQRKAIYEDQEQIPELHFQFHRVSNPEFLREGTAVTDFPHNLDVVTAMRTGLSPAALGEANRIRTQHHGS